MTRRPMSLERDADTPPAVAAWVQEIANTARDPENAHALEDELWEAVLRAIAEGRASDPAMLASIALQTVDISFERWHA